ncbi:protein adenylyltransferase SelO [Rhizobium jaguaris]|uniref:Protein nucleotidyltransferase YdiU n=1 Tax=Rhizobium jaguaris TaxID=1312183 RepID=A0A387FI07_9HYPH|nr:YdiU family protein [Rhizobium jaguaris]AYG58498.1 YdiU family protein [Rhizobium jaguaris]
MSSSLHDKAVFDALPIPFDNSYVHLPPQFFAEQAPAPVAAPRLIKFNTALARDLGLDADALERDGAAIFSGNKLLPGSQPIAMAYAGHQFGGFVPQLGDGRAILLGEVIDRSGRRRDIQLKGAGPTPFSRRGDGRAALGPVLREYIVSEAMHALGIPTTRALAAVTTGEPVYREEVLPGAVFTRVAASHIRVGTFQYFAARGDSDSLRILADYVVDRHYSEIKDRKNRYLALMEAVAERQAALIARWLHVGFIHGVMNTDNMTISGETIDYGPCAFVDTYNSATVFSSIDHHGRYAYANQPAIGQWNLARLGETLLSLIDPSLDTAVDLANAVIKDYGERFQAHWLTGMRAKIGLATEGDDDLDLIQALLALMQQQGADFTLTFRRLSNLAESDDGEAAFATSFKDPASAAPWLARWRERINREPKLPIDRARAMRGVNPAFIPRNHRIEQAIEAAVEDEDFSLFEVLLKVLAKPYEDQPAFAPYAEPPQPAERVLQTFCGT